MHSFLIIFATAALAQAQSTVDPILLSSIFGPPPNKPTPGPTAPTVEDTTQVTRGLEYITVQPTNKPTIGTDENGEQCVCLPYYLCDSRNIAVDENNATVTGYGVIDVRFGEPNQGNQKNPKTRCQESVEKCCTRPIKESEVVEPQIPDPSSLKRCGYRNPKGLDVTLIGGTGKEAQFGEFPWVAALIDATNNSYAGVGALIHPQVVITGAHVAYKYGPDRLLARLGEWDTQTLKERLKHQQRLVDDIIIHSDFNPTTLAYDIALLRLKEPVMLTQHINVICMPQQDEDFENSKKCIANGWGKDVFGVQGRYAVFLKRVIMDMVPYERCEQQFQQTRLGYNFKLHQTFVCAGGEEGKDTCQGDGGAPLVCPIPGVKDRYKLTGLVAWGIGCGTKNIPGANAAVSKFRNWVDNHMSSWGFDTSIYNV